MLHSQRHSPCATTQEGRTPDLLKGQGIYTCPPDVGLDMLQRQEEVRDWGSFREPHPWWVMYVAPLSSLSPSQGKLEPGGGTKWTAETWLWVGKISIVKPLPFHDSWAISNVFDIGDAAMNVFV